MSNNYYIYFQNDGIEVYNGKKVKVAELKTHIPVNSETSGTICLSVLNHGGIAASTSQDYDMNIVWKLDISSNFG